MFHWVSIQEDPRSVDSLKKLYISAFPWAERAPFFYVVRQSTTPMADLFAICDDDAVVGMANTVYDQDVVFLFYLAIAPERQGQGYGSLALEETKRRFAGKRVILNIEEMAETQPGYEQRLRRKQFYLKNGLEESHYKTRERGIVYEMLHLGGDATYEEYAALLRAYLGPVLYRAIRLKKAE